MHLDLRNENSHFDQTNIPTAPGQKQLCPAQWARKATRPHTRSEHWQRAEVMRKGSCEFQDETESGQVTVWPPL